MFRGAGNGGVQTRLLQTGVYKPIGKDLLIGKNLDYLCERQAEGAYISNGSIQK
jgi:hypothetical protein